MILVSIKSINNPNKQGQKKTLHPGKRISNLKKKKKKKGKKRQKTGSNGSLKGEGKERKVSKKE